MSCDGCRFLLSNEAESMDLIVVKGMTLGPFTCDMVDDNDDPIDLTGTSFRLEILEPMSDMESPEAIVLVTISVDLVADPDDNVYQWAIEPDDISALACGVNPKKSIGKYPWRLIWTDLTPKDILLYSGTLFHRC